MGVYSNTGFFKGNKLIGTSRAGALDRGDVACEFAGTMSADGHFTDDSMPFHCQCFPREGGVPWGAKLEVHQWGRPHEDEDLKQSFNPWTGSTGNVYEQVSTPWSAGRDSLVSRCTDHRGVERWCWKGANANMKEEELPLLNRGKHCAAYGAQLGQTMAYVAIHLGEILTLLTYRTNGPCFSDGNLLSNPYYTGFFLFNFTMLLIFVYSPVQDILQLAPLTRERFGLAVCFPIILLLLNEAFKVVYRSQLAAQNEELSKNALAQSHGHEAHKREKEDV